MTVARSVLAVNDDLPIITESEVHSGKVRSVYWLTDCDSQRLIKQHNYPVPLNTPLAVMVISDRISAFDCIWQGEGGLKGVPGKGAALNAISNHWFDLFKQHGLAESHILDIPHPFVWIVQKAKPVYIEAIGRQYITGSMWRAYAQGEREFCGIKLLEGLEKNDKLDELLITPSTKGILKGIPGVQEADDANISRANIADNYKAFNFLAKQDIDLYQYLLKQGFELISTALDAIGEIFVDSKFEFGYVKDQQGKDKLIYMDEVGTPDSSRIWSKPQYEQGQIVEKSKEGFRQFLLNYFPEPDILLNKNRMPERMALAQDNLLPEQVLLDVSATYQDIASKITGKPLPVSIDPKSEIIEVLSSRYRLVK